jgi:hypothetical protein
MQPRLPGICDTLQSIAAWHWRHGFAIVGAMQQFVPRAGARLGLLLAFILPLAALAAEKDPAPKGAAKAPAQGQAPPGATSSTPQELGGARGWSAYSYAEKGGKVCYVVGKPQKSEPANASRGRIDAIITHRPAEHAANVVSFDVGYPFKEGSSAELEVDGRKFTLFTDKEAVWAPDAATDKQVTETLAKSKHATLKGTSQRGTSTTDTYALDGLAQALALIDKTCNVKR